MTRHQVPPELGMEEWHCMNERLALCGAHLLRTLVLKLLKGNSSDKCTSITIKYSAGVLFSTGEIFQVPKKTAEVQDVNEARTRIGTKYNKPQID